MTNPLTPEPSYQKYLVISGGEGVDLFEKTTLSQRFHFFKDNGIDFARLEKLKSGDILLTSKGPVSSAKAKKVQTILDIKVNVSGHKALNSSKGVVKNPDDSASRSQNLLLVRKFYLITFQVKKNAKFSIKIFGLVINNF